MPEHLHCRRETLGKKTFEFDLGDPDASLDPENTDLPGPNDPPAGPLAHAESLSKGGDVKKTF